MKRMPYGISSFKVLRERDFCYVDKTRFIEKIENCANYLSLFRPRKMGKSLFLSTLECYYDYKYTDEFTTLFQGTWIGDNPTKGKNSYTILNLDFSGVSADNPEVLKNAFSSKIIEKFFAFLEENDFKLSKPLLSTELPAQIADSFFSQIASIVQYPIYLLIDEVDNLANEMFGNANNLKTVLLSGGFFRDFFAVIKEHTKSNTIQKIFLTGVTPLVLGYLTSGFNIALNITLNPLFNDMLGFTTVELEGFAISSLSHLDLDIDYIMAQMTMLYNGYRFSPLDDHSVFNPSMVTYYLMAHSLTNSPPMALLDPNILSDCSKIQAITSIAIAGSTFGVLKEIEKAIKHRQAILASIASGKSQRTKLTQVFSLDNFSDSDFLSVMLYMGYLTISDFNSGIATLKIPNLVLKHIYDKYFEDIVLPKMPGIQ